MERLEHEGCQVIQCLWSRPLRSHFEILSDRTVTWAAVKILGQPTNHRMEIRTIILYKIYFLLALKCFLWPWRVTQRDLQASSLIWKYPILCKGRNQRRVFWIFDLLHALSNSWLCEGLLHSQSINSHDQTIKQFVFWRWEIKHQNSFKSVTLFSLKDILSNPGSKKTNQKKSEPKTKNIHWTTIL